MIIFSVPSAHRKLLRSKSCWSSPGGQRCGKVGKISPAGMGQERWAQATGIPAAEQTRIFEQFHRVDNSLIIASRPWTAPWASLRRLQSAPTPAQCHSATRVRRLWRHRSHQNNSATTLAV